MSTKEFVHALDEVFAFVIQTLVHTAGESSEGLVESARGMRLRCGRLRPLHALHGFAEDSLQSFRTNGLDDVVVHAGAACALPIHFLPPARQRDDAYVSTLWQGPDTRVSLLRRRRAAFRDP
jgi:hypothetical protein